MVFLIILLFPPISPLTKKTPNFLRCELAQERAIVAACLESAVSSVMMALKLPTFKWAAARRMRCHLPDANGDGNREKGPNSPPETKKVEAALTDREAARAATAAFHKKDASFKPRPFPDEGGGEEKRKRKKEKMAEFRLNLTKDEIDDDFFAMMGARPPRKPKRRPKAVRSKIEVKDDSFIVSL